MVSGGGRSNGTASIERPRDRMAYRPIEDCSSDRKAGEHNSHVCSASSREILCHDSKSSGPLRARQLLNARRVAESHIERKHPVGVVLGGTYGFSNRCSRAATLPTTSTSTRYFHR